MCVSELTKVLAATAYCVCIHVQMIVSWVGSQANIFEKQKVREIAALIRDTERHGKAQITSINEGEETPEMLKVRKCIIKLT